jgi:hypothetical protein
MYLVLNLNEVALFLVQTRLVFLKKLRQPTRKGVRVKCERVGVMAFHSCINAANPWIYPWEATSRLSP